MSGAFAYLYNELNSKQGEEFVNPTGNGIRGCDIHGCGEFGASRIHGSHRGTDYIAGLGSTGTGQDILAVRGGMVSKIGYPYWDDLSYRYVEITTLDGYRIREFYVSPIDGLKRGSLVEAGQVIGTYQSLQRRYPEITDHVHVEIMKNGKHIDPALLIP